jgi:hypothetical protein
MQLRTRSSIVGRARAGVRPGRPTRRGAGAARPGSEGTGVAAGSTVLTDLLTTALDNPGPEWNEKSGEQGGCDRMDDPGLP